MKKLLVVLAIILSGCAAIPPSRPQYSQPIPALDQGLARLSFISGRLDNTIPVDLKFETNTGPVFINGQNVGRPARQEYIVVDLVPGTYEAYWKPSKHEDEKLCIQKFPLTVKAGETRAYAADLSVEAGMHFGLIGALVSTCLQKTLLNERDLPPDSRLVSYTKLQKQNTQVEIKTEQPTNSLEANNESKQNTASTNSYSPVQADIDKRLEKLNELFGKGLLTKEEYLAKKKEILDSL